MPAMQYRRRKLVWRQDIGEIHSVQCITHKILHHTSRAVEYYSDCAVSMELPGKVRAKNDEKIHFWVTQCWAHATQI